MNPLSSSVRGTSRRGWICRACQKWPASISRASHYSTESKPIKTPARTRFAPSPTGYLHLGSLRTALFNYLFAKSTGGQFILRIEDTDQSRTIADSEAKLSRDLKWAGLEWDEGPDVGGPYGPYRQSERTELYREHAHKLLQSKHAYRCFCTPERLRALGTHKQLLGLAPDYDRTCIHISSEESDDRASKGEAHVIRLKVPDVYPEMKDLVHKRIRFSVPSEKEKPLPGFEDPVLLKSDGFPTYHLANVVDDYHMKITHVIRGSEWINSTPKHIVMYNAFGWKVPIFGHVGLLTNQHGTKLSKRSKVDGIDMTVESLRDEEGVLPEAMVNFVALLGWSHGLRSDIMDLQQLVQNFTPKFTKGNTVVNFEKLWYLQRSHAERLVKSNAPAVDTMINSIVENLTDDAYEDISSYWCIILDGRRRSEYIRDILRSDRRNYTTPKAFVERNKFFFNYLDEEWLAHKLPELMETFEKSGLNANISILDIVELAKTIPPTPEPTETSSDKNPDPAEPTSSSSEDSTPLPTSLEQQFSVANLKVRIDEVLARETARIMEIKGAREGKEGVKKALAKFLHVYLRWAVLGSMPGPSSAETMWLLGAEETKKRLTRAGKVVRRSIKTQRREASRMEREVEETGTL